MDGMPLDELSECCKLTVQVKDRELAGAVSAAQQAAEVEIDRLEARIVELERFAFEKAKLSSSLEGEIAGLKHKLEQMSKLVPPPPPQPASAVPAPAPPQAKKCVVCGRVCASMCPTCKAFVCVSQGCSHRHGHGEMYRP